MSKTEAKIISKPDTGNSSNSSSTNSNSTESTVGTKTDTSSNTAAVSSDVIVGSVPSTPTVTVISGKDTSNTSSNTSSNNDSSNNKTKETKSKEMPTEVITKKLNRKIAAPKIGLYNRTNYNLHVVFKKEDILFPPRKRTEKIYKESEIQTVQGKPLQMAIAEGLISIVR